MRIILTFLFACFLAPSSVLAAPASTDCDEAAEVGAQTYDATDKEFYYCRDHTDGWEALGAIAPAAGGGSSGPTYEGTTPSTVNLGTNPGIDGIDDLCDAAYPGSRMMYSSDLKTLRTSITNSDEAWFFCDDVEYASSSVQFCFSSGATNDKRFSAGYDYINCGAFKSSSGYQGMTYQGSSAQVRVELCTVSKKAHCVSD